MSFLQTLPKTQQTARIHWQEEYLGEWVFVATLADGQLGLVSWIEGEVDGEFHPTPMLTVSGAIQEAERVFTEGFDSPQ